LRQLLLEPCSARGIFATEPALLTAKPVLVAEGQLTDQILTRHGRQF
jgi:hypothetical protein